MNAWMPVYGFESSYEINIIDGIVRRIVKDITKSENPLPNVPIEEQCGDITKFLGFGVVLLDKDNTEHLLPIDKLVVEAIMRKPINQKIYRKNNFIIDCCYKNLTLTPTPEPIRVVPATKEGTFYQYKAVETREDGKIKKQYVLQKIYDKYEDFASETGLSIDDFIHEDEPVDKLKIGVYMWSTRDLGIKPLQPQQNVSLNQMAIA